MMVVGITALLSDLPAGCIAAWWDTPRAELYGLTPHEAMRQPQPMGFLVRAVARKDYEDRRAEDRSVLA